MTKEDRVELREIACALQDSHAHALHIQKLLWDKTLSFPTLRNEILDDIKSWDANYFHIQKRLKDIYERNNK